MQLLVAERALRDRRRGSIGWALGLFTYVGLMTIFFPAVQSSDLQRAIRSYPPELKAFFGGSSFDLSTGAGFLNVELFSLVIPALLSIVAIAYGARTLAGEQEDGTLDLPLSHPISRRRLVFEKIVGLATVVFGLACVVVVTLVGVGAIVGLGVPVDRLVIGCLGAALAAIVFGLVAMLAGAATGRRAAAIGVPAALFAASYLIVGLAGLVSSLKPLRFVSPLYHANGTQPLVHGFPVANYLLLIALVVGMARATSAVFERRDLVH